jgi:hypothetical protein
LQNQQKGGNGENGQILTTAESSVKGIHNMAECHDKTLELLATGNPATPEQINNHVGKGEYAAQYICWLRKRGHTILSKRDGRTVIAYMLLPPGAEPPYEIGTAAVATTYTPAPTPRPTPTKQAPSPHRHQQPTHHQPSTPYAVDQDWDGGDDINLRSMIG